MSEEDKQVMSWKDKLAEDAKKVAATERPSSGFISLKSGVMTYQDEMIPGNKLDCVIVAYGSERTMYDRAYDPDDQGPPECFAQAIEAVELNPHSNVVAPVNATCMGCPKAEFGTAKQGKGPACKTYRKLAVMPVTALDGDIAGAEVALMRIPPTSVKNFSQYANKLATAGGLPPWASVTTISVAPHPKKQFEVSFAAVRPITDEATLAAIHARIESVEALLLSPYEYSDEDEAPAKKGKSKF